MQTLELECPSCNEMLELDAGFAGGVCRCSSCGTLMTVPSDAGKAETISRPSSAGESSFQTTGMERRARTGGKGKKGKKKDRAPVETIEAGEYRTESGKVIRVEQTTRVPMAESKRKKVRLVTTVAFFGVVLGVVAAAVVAIVMMVGAPGGVGGGEEEGPPVYDPAANPYTLPFANLAGVPISGRVVVVVEASYDSGEWTPSVGDVFQAGLKDKPESDAKVAFYAAAEGEPVVFDSGSPTPIGQIDPETLKEWFLDLPDDAEEGVDFTAAIEAALETSPSTLVIVMGRVDEQEVAAWQESAAGRFGLVVHAVMLEGVQQPVRDWLSGQRRSVLVDLSPQDIDNFRFIADKD